MMLLLLDRPGPSVGLVLPSCAIPGCGRVVESSTSVRVQAGSTGIWNWHRKVHCPKWCRLRGILKAFYAFCLFAFKQQWKWWHFGFLSSITRVKSAHNAKHWTSFINRAATKPAAQGEKEDVLQAALALLYPLAKARLKAKPHGTARPVSMCYVLLSLTAPTQQVLHSPGCCPLLCGGREQCCLCLQYGFDLGIKSLQCISSFPRLCCFSPLEGRHFIDPCL